MNRPLVWRRQPLAALSRRCEGRCDPQRHIYVHWANLWFVRHVNHIFSIRFDRSHLWTGGWFTKRQSSSIVYAFLNNGGDKGFGIAIHLLCGNSRRICALYPNRIKRQFSIRPGVTQVDSLSGCNQGESFPHFAVPWLAFTSDQGLVYMISCLT